MAKTPIAHSEEGARMEEGNDDYLFVSQMLVQYLVDGDIIIIINSYTAGL